MVWIMTTVFEFITEHPIWMLLLFVVCSLLCMHLLFGSGQSKSLKDLPRVFPQDERKGQAKDHFDVAIVGAGPSGATCGYFLGKAGRQVVILEKKKFPRDKYCGDAVCKTAIEILSEMGVFQQLLAENKAHVADSGGLVSPGGLSFIGHSKEHIGQVPAAVACKRIHLDEAIARAAQRAGAHLIEDSPVDTAVFDPNTGLWTITVEETKKTFTARVLVCADGATSRLATKLGIVKDPPVSNCSRSYVKEGTHKFKADGVVFYHKDMLPGYSALFRHPGGELNYCVYIIPGNPKVTQDDLPYWHDFLKDKDPFISKALGPDYQIERMKAASLRLGGEAVSFDDHVLVVGDAAGMIDPMTGEGIHHAIEGGKLAAGFLCEALSHGNYSKQAMAIYHQRWMKQFGSDFKWSMAFCQMLYRYPILLDAATMALIRKGDKFLVKWADIMTGRVPKINMLKPEFSVVITYELVKLLIKRLLGIKPVTGKTKAD